MNNISITEPHFSYCIYTKANKTYQQLLTAFHYPTNTLSPVNNAPTAIKKALLGVGINVAQVYS